MYLMTSIIRIFYFDLEFKCQHICCMDIVLGWWNGRHRGLKILWAFARAGSSPVPSKVLVYDRLELV